MQLNKRHIQDISRWMLIALLLVSLSMLSLTACERPLHTDDDANVYTFDEPQAPEGTGRFYMGREIAQSPDSSFFAWLERADREQIELPYRVIKGLNLSPSNNVADIGAGRGYFTFRISERVPRGMVYAVETDPYMREILVERVENEGLRNVEVIEGVPTNPRLPEERIDIALMVDAYHEFSHPREMKEQVYRALRPGGRAVVVEYRAEDPTVPILSLHRMSEEQIRAEFEAAGFDWRETRSFLPMQHFVVFQKPVER